MIEIEVFLYIWDVKEKKNTNHKLFLVSDTK